MHRGKFTETGTKKDIYANPKHIYTKRLVASIPHINPELREELKEKRIAIDEEFDREYSNYYNKEGKVFELEELTPTHFVAKKKGVK